MLDLDSKDKLFVGMDPGKEGAIVVIQGNKVIKFPFPMIGTEYDVPEINKFIKSLKETKGDLHVVIEDVSPIQGSAAKANWSFSRGKAILEVLSIAHELPFTMVRPKAWQKQIHQGIPKLENPKQMTLMAIKRLFPEVDLRKTERSKKDHDGIYDALAMAEYCRRNFY